MELKLNCNSELFKKFNDIAIKNNKYETFCDIFSEFIVILDSLDLSDETINYLYDMFIKDMYIYFKKDCEYISKKKIEEFIKEELPDDEICSFCDRYDVNGVEIKEKLQKLLEEK